MKTQEGLIEELSQIREIVADALDEINDFLEEIKDGGDLDAQWEITGGLIRGLRADLLPTERLFDG